MTFLWPEMLLLLLLLPALVAVYVLMLGRRKKLALRYASLTVVKEALGAGQGWRRHLPPALFLLAIAAMLVAVARPAALITLPSQHELIVLAIDVSGSMRATDVAPTRLAAAQAAARSFVEDTPMTTRIAVVSFAGTAAVVQPPTLSREDAIAAIERFQLQRGTAVGSGILVSLKTIFPEIEFDLSSTNPRLEPGSRDPTRAMSLDQPPAREPDAVRPVPPGSYKSAAIILLTDGQTTTGPEPMESAKMAAERGVRVFTVGVGTPAGEIIGSEGWSMRVRLDEDVLKNIAGITNAEYFYAGNAPDLTKVYKTLNSKLVMEKKTTEITAVFSAIAAGLALMSALLSMLWFNRIL
ncbi:VWA domain-containing protein [Lacisediminimonas sp.]|uniref:VWA domain-containing protein n=1 Tax=Lacisediminimonas sp. TaxID=3060582 RepID=UPI00271C6147|nr:VWA domain-containing protein [Lacisediminimonas sp.]MDO8298193.1 VWA domain-containing protein [Lacisediminimonas sp.]